MALTFVQASPTEAVASGATSVSQAYGVNTTGSSFLLAYGVVTDITAVLTLTDTLGNTWNKIDTLVVAGIQPIVLFWAKNVAGGGANTVTLHSTVSATVVLATAEYTGQAASNPIDVVTHALWNNATASIGPVSTSYTNETLIAFGRVNGGIAITGADGTIRVNGVNAIVLEDRSIPTAGSYTASWTNPNTANNSGFVIGVKSATSVANVYSEPDCRVTPFGPNASRNVQGTLTYDKQTSSNSAIPPVDSRTTGAPVDSRNPVLIRQNSRTPGTYGPGN